jgi:hypothetical protein
MFPKSFFRGDTYKITFSHPEKSLHMKMYYKSQKADSRNLFRRSAVTIRNEHHRHNTTKQNLKHLLTKKNKEAVRSAWKLFQYCQLPDKN